MIDLRKKVAVAIIKEFSENSPDMARDMKMEPDAWMDEADAAIRVVLDALKDPSIGMVRAGVDAVDAIDFAMALREAVVDPSSMPDLDSGHTARAAWGEMLRAFTRDHYLSALAREDGKEL